ncbi:MAG: hypothetical protein ABI910_12305, partial [Gemmatimonadota bacterium]
MRMRPLALRLLAALVAVVQGFAPGAASLIDARPAARAVSERAIAHVDEPGSPHTFAHRDHCVLCSAATHLAAATVVAAPPVDTHAGDWPARAARFVVHGA